MSIMTRLGARSLILSIAETVLFFCLTAIYFAGPNWLYGRIQQPKIEARDAARTAAMEKAKASAIAEGKPQADAEAEAQAAVDAIGARIRAKSLPIWLWVALGLAYLLIVTVWWAPGDAEDNRTELTALSIVSVAVLLGVGVFVQLKYGAVSNIAGEFWKILTTGGGRTG